MFIFSERFKSFFYEGTDLKGSDPLRPGGSPSRVCVKKIKK